MDSLIYEHPEEAVEMLDSLRGSCRTRSDSALYFLLRAKAMDKSYMTFDEDSLLSVSVDYYAGRGDSLEVQALYYYGYNLAANRKDYDWALVYLNEAYLKSTAIGCDFYAGLSARMMSDVYHDLIIHGKQLEWAIKARESFDRGGWHKYGGYMDNWIMDALPRLGRAQEALDLSERIDSSLLENDFFRNQILKSKIDAYDWLGRYDEAIACFGELTDGGYSPDARDWAVLGEFYLKTGDIPKAIMAVDSARHILTSDKDSLYVQYLTAILLGKEGRYKEAFDEAIDWSHRMTDRDGQMIMNPKTMELTNFYILKSQNEMIRREKNSQALVFSIVICVLLAVILVGAGVLHKMRLRAKQIEITALIGQIKSLDNDLSAIRSTKRELEDSVNEYKEINAQLSSLQSDISEQRLRSDRLREALGQLFEHQLSVLDGMCETWYRNVDTLDRSNFFYKDIVKILDGFRQIEFLSALENTINTYDNGWMNEFRSVYPDLKREQYQLVLYLYVGLSTSAITMLLGKKTANAVYMMKHKLRTRLLADNDEKAIRMCGKLGF